MDIECKFYLRDYLSNGYYCQVTAANIIHSGLEVRSFEGVHEHEMGDRDVTHLIFNATEVHYLPRNIHNIFPNLVSLQVTKCGLKDLRRADLVGLQNLEKVNFRSNELTTLPDDLFVGMTKLRLIYFCHNQLEFMSGKLFDPIKNNDIEYIEFRKNKTIDVFFSKYVKHANMKNLINCINKNCTPPSQVSDFESKFEETTKQFEQLFITGKFSDFNIKIHGKEFKLHKNILGTQSSVFEEMFSSGNEEELETILSEKILSVETFDDFFWFFYSGKVRTEEKALELFELAAEFGVHELIRDCQDIILRNLNETNMLEVYNFGYANGLNQLKIAAFEEIKIKFPGISDDIINEPKIVNDLVEAQRNLDEILEVAKNYFKYP